MEEFYLIQRGVFREPDSKTLIGPGGVVRLYPMGSAEFEWGAIPRAYRRLMYHYKEYEIFNTEIYTPEKEELMVFSKKDCASEVIQGIREFIEQPYSLKEKSELEKVPKAKKGDTSYNRRISDFWWCIDLYGNWMAFLKPQYNLFKETVESDHQKWWMKKTPEEREEEYKQSLRE